MNDSTTNLESTATYDLPFSTSCSLSIKSFLMFPNRYGHFLRLHMTHTWTGYAVKLDFRD